MPRQNLKSVTNKQKQGVRKKKKNGIDQECLHIATEALLGAPFPTDNVP